MTNEYEIEIDDEICDKKFIKDFKKYFYDFDTLEEHAEHLSQHRARFRQNFIEGYGVPLINGKKPLRYPEYDDKEIAKGININIISEDAPSGIEVDVMEVKNNK